MLSFISVVNFDIKTELEMLYELWHSETECSYSYIRSDANYEKHKEVNLRFAQDYKLIWQYYAGSHFQAMQAQYDFLGYGIYKPEPDWEDTIYEF